MSYLYCLELQIKTQDDVNALFREAKLKGELTANAQNQYFICPQLSSTMWQIYPQVKTQMLPATIDKRWNEVIAECITLLEKRYTISFSLDEIGWRNVGSVYRCSKMESFVREQDISC